MGMMNLFDNSTARRKALDPEPKWWRSLLDNVGWVDAAVSCYAVGAGLDPKDFTIEVEREVLKYKITYAGNGRYVLIGGMIGYATPLMDMPEYLQSLVRAKSTPEAPPGGKS